MKIYKIIKIMLLTIVVSASSDHLCRIKEINSEHDCNILTYLLVSVKDLRMIHTSQNVV